MYSIPKLTKLMLLCQLLNTTYQQPILGLSVVGVFVPLKYPRLRFFRIFVFHRKTSDYDFFIFFVFFFGPPKYLRLRWYFIELKDQELRDWFISLESFEIHFILYNTQLLNDQITDNEWKIVVTGVTIK